MADKATISVKDDKSSTSFVILVTADQESSNPSGLPSHDGQNGEWRKQLTDCKFASKYSRDATQCTANDVNAAVIFERWGDAIRYEDALAEATFLRYLVTSRLRSRVSEIHAGWKTEHEVPDEASRLELRGDLPLKDYQQVAAACSMMLPGYALFMEQGTGKTPVVVSRVCTDALKLRASGETRMYHAIVVCPKNVRANWAREFRRFSTVKGKVTVMRSGHLGRIRELAEAMSHFDDELYSVVVISYGLLVNAWDSLLQFVDWDLGVVDEMHSIKWHQTDRTQACWRLRDKCRARMGLTGTPVVNSAMDLFSQLEFLDRGLSGHTSYDGFKEKYGVWARTADGGRDVMTHVKNMPLLKRRLSEAAFIVRKDEVLKDLPDKQYDILEVELSKRQQDDYDSMESQYVIEIEDDMRAAEESGDDAKMSIVANNALTKLMKLAQITSGFLNVPEERDENGDVVQEATRIVYSPNPKLDVLGEALVEYLANNPLDKVLIWTCFRFDVDSVVERLRGLGVDHVRFDGSTNDRDRASAERRYNEDPCCRAWVGNAAAGGVGLNLLGYVPGVNDALGTNTAWEVYYSQSQRPVDRWQSEDRGHRTGTRVPVRITDLVVPGTIDEDIRARVLDKKKHALDVQDLREIMTMIQQRREERRSRR